MAGRTPWSEIKHKSTPEQRAKAKAELEASLAETVPISKGLLFPILDTLRLAHVAALKDSPNAHLLPEDFKPHKWDDFEVEFANDASEQYRKLIVEMTVVNGVCQLCGSGVLDGEHLRADLEPCLGRNTLEG